ncbi:MAG TPA: ribosome-associated translation inhibitor RaiA [Victivallales bacterium]|nr:ribosome-associated translation inhibitor RaiA [Victivallales bacterium]HRR29396.1 ribosome-associated translation inhibitor RaiA [Victivallales bacterium]
MEIIISGRHFNVSESLKSYATEQINTIISGYRKVNNVHLILDQQKGRAKAEVIVHGKNINYEADSEDFDMYKAIDDAIAKVDKQLEKHFEKVQDHRKKTKNLKALE